MTPRDFLSRDKLAHLAAGLSICWAVNLFAPELAMLACAVTAWLKERRDFLRPTSHTADGWDAYATVLGGAVFQAWQLAWPMLAGAMR